MITTTKTNKVYLMMPFIYITLIFAATLLNAVDFDSTYTLGSNNCSPLLQNLSPNNKKCNEQSFHYNQNLAPLLDGSTSIEYALKKDIATEKVSMVANYYKDGFIAQLLSSYEKDITTDDGYSSDTVINLTYQNKLSEAFATTISQSVFLPTQTSNIEANPPSYTSILETQYSINSTYKIFTQNNYTHLEKYSNISLRNPYGFETGINYTNNKRTSLAVSYSQAKDKDSSIKTKKISALTLKRKINKKIKTSLTIHKSFTSYPAENKASVKFNYSF